MPGSKDDAEFEDILAAFNSAANSKSTKRQKNKPSNDQARAAVPKVEVQNAGATPDAAAALSHDSRNMTVEDVAKLPIRDLPEQDNSHLRLVGNWPAIPDTRQTVPATVPPHLMCPGTAGCPAGVEEAYLGNNGFRTTSEEKRVLDHCNFDEVLKARRAAEVHRQVRKYVQSFIQPGMTFTEIVTRLEGKTMELVAADGLKCGKGFPTGISVNHCAAHWTPNPGDTTVLQKDDLIKLDFGVQVGGRIIDSAFTIGFNPRYDELIKATQEGTNVGIREAGIDARFSEIGAAIEEAIRAHEVEIDGKVFEIKPIRNLNGHTINSYQIHGGKSVPIVRNHDPTVMEEGEFYAIETFASTGKGYVTDGPDCSHYMKSGYDLHASLRVKGAKQLLNCIDKSFSTLAFCRRWLNDVGQVKHLLALKSLVDAQIVTPYPPLVDVKGCYTSQMEHTLVLRPTCKEVLSRGDDY